MYIRLINPFQIELRQLDTAATANAGGYDAEFQTTRAKIVSGQRQSSRVEKAAIRINAQLEDSVFNALKMIANGDSPEQKLAIVFRYPEIKEAGLVDPNTGLPLLNVNDRLSAIYDRDGQLVHTIPTPPGLYCIEVRPMSYGIGHRLGLVMMRFEERAQGAEV